MEKSKKSKEIPIEQPKLVRQYGMYKASTSKREFIKWTDFIKSLDSLSKKVKEEIKKKPK